VLHAAADGPRVVIADIDLPGAIEVIDRAREAAPSSELICVGDAARTAELGLRRTDGRSFVRPLDVAALVIAVLALAEPGVPPPRRSDPARAGGRTFPGSAPRVSAPPPRQADSEAPPASDHSGADPLEIAAILPMLDEGDAPLDPIELSPE